MKNFISEIILSIILSIVLIFLLSIIVSKTSITEDIIIPSTIGIVCVSLMIGAYKLTKKQKEKGILYGSILGMIYMLILYLLSSFANFDFSLSINSIILIIIGIIGGAIGGILGVNF